MSKVFTIAEGLENLGAIKTGGQGSVYKGKRVGEVITAIKLLPTPIFSQDESDTHYRDFINEVKKMQRVNEEPNPNVVTFLSYGISETGGFPYIEMEFIDGPDLCELLKAPHPPLFTIRETIKVAEHLAHALAHCHKLDVKHGDIKSNNVKYDRRTGNYVLIDFGLSILSDEERRTSLRNAGAIEFMAPEQNEGQMFFETDVYSFGIILFELLAGRVPFPLNGNSETARNRVMMAHLETPPPELLPIRQEALPAKWTEDQRSNQLEVPDWLLSIIYKCLEKKPEDRFQNGQELLEAIHQHSTQFSSFQNDAILIGSSNSDVNSLLNQIAEKDKELEQLKTTLVRQEQELQVLRSPHYANVAAPAPNVPVSSFKGWQVMAIVFGLVALFSLFLNSKNVFVSSSTSNSPSYSDSVVSSNAAKTDVETNGNESKGSTDKSLLRKNSGKQLTDGLNKNDGNIDDQEQTSIDEEKPVKPIAQKADTVQKKVLLTETKSTATESKKEEPNKNDNNKEDNKKEDAKKEKAGSSSTE